MSRRWVWIFAVALPLLHLATVATAAEKIRINQRPATVQVRTFDPADPPPEMPPLKGDEAAVTASVFGIGSRFEVEILHDSQSGGTHRAEVKIDSVSATLTLTITIWVPHGVSRAVMAHEQGHRRISEQFYKDAEKLTRDVAGRYIGRKSVGEGRDSTAAAQAALNVAIKEFAQDYLRVIEVPAARVNDIFDAITDHGRNAGITEDQAIQRAMEQYRREEEKRRGQ